MKYEEEEKLENLRHQNRVKELNIQAQIQTDLLREEFRLRGIIEEQPQPTQQPQPYYGPLPEVPTPKDKYRENPDSYEGD